MRPKYQISLDGNDITSNFNDRLLTLTVNDYAGDASNEADKLEITLDDRDGLLDIPPKGRSLEVFLGYEETGIQSMGIYTIDTIKLAHKPSIMTISGKSADMSTQSIKEHRTNTYENQTLSQIANTIAGRQGLQVYADPSLDQTPFTTLHQSDESDMNFMWRLARDHDALFKIAGGMMLLVKRNGLSSSGASMGVNVTPNMVVPGTCIVTLPDRSKFDAANAYYFDQTTQQRKTVSSSGTGEATGFFLRHPLTSQQKAQAAATAREAELNRQEAKAECTLAFGDPSVAAAGTLNLSGFRTGIDGSYTITSVEHNLDSAGYTTKIEGDNGGSSDNSEDN